MKLKSSRNLVIHLLTFSAIGVHAAESLSFTFTSQHVCRAAIAVAFGQDPKIIKVDRVIGEVTYLHYNRPSDGKYWDYRSKTSGNRVIWAAVDGRWREHPADEKLEFTTTSSTITIEEKYTDGSKTIKTFTNSQLGK